MITNRQRPGIYYTSTSVFLCRSQRVSLDTPVDHSDDHAPRPPPAHARQPTPATSAAHQEYHRHAPAISQPARFPAFQGPYTHAAFIEPEALALPIARVK